MSYFRLTDLNSFAEVSLTASKDLFHKKCCFSMKSRFALRVNSCSLIVGLALPVNAFYFSLSLASSFYIPNL